MVDDLTQVDYDPDLHRYHKQHWSEWIESKEFGIAFKAYWKNGTVPKTQYPKSLIIKNKKEGTVSYVQLNGTHDWSDTYHGDYMNKYFMETAIYNIQLATWYNKRERSKALKNFLDSTSRMTGNLSSNLSSMGRRLPVLQIITWVLVAVIAYSLIAIVNSYPVPDWLVSDDASRFIFPITTVLLIICFIKTYGILLKIVYALFTFIGIIFSLMVFGVIGGQEFLAIWLITLIGIIGLIIIGIRLLLVALWFFSAGFGGVAGGRMGWDFAGRLRGKR